MRFQYSNRSSVVALLMAGFVAVSCSKKKEDDAAAPTASSVADLKLSTALAIEIPDALATASGGSAATLALTGGTKLVGKKSSEACRTMQNVNQVMKNLSQIGNMFCHLEIESDKMKFGTKYNVSIVGGEEQGLADQTMNIWVDNSDATKLKVYSCEGGALTEAFTIDGFAGEGKAKGTIFTKHDGDHGNYVASLEFDFSQAGYKIIDAKMKHSYNSDTFRNHSSVKIADTGASTFKMSMSGTHNGDAMEDQGAVLFDAASGGQALFAGSGTCAQCGGSGEYTYNSKSTFDKDGITIASTSAAANVVVDKSMLPELLASDFTPDSPSGWDCTGATESIVIDMVADATKKAAHDACSGNNGHQWQSCFGEDFEFGENQ